MPDVFGVTREERDAQRLKQAQEPWTVRGHSSGMAMCHKLWGIDNKYQLYHRPMEYGAGQFFRTMFMTKSKSRLQPVLTSLDQVIGLEKLSPENRKNLQCMWDAAICFKGDSVTSSTKKTAGQKRPQDMTKAELIDEVTVLREQMSSKKAKSS